MIMKMTKSTSRISINGTTLSSTMVPRCAPPTAIAMSHLALKHAPRGGLSHHLRGRDGAAGPRKNLLTSLELGGDQTDPVDAGAAHDVNGAGDFGKQYIVIAFDESYFLRAVFENLFDARAETIP